MSSGSDTRRALAVALKDKLRREPLDKVTVTGLAAAAGITRQGFYYHFTDVYDLAAWVFKKDIADHIMTHSSYGDWADGFLQMLIYMRTHRVQTTAVVSSLSHRELERFFYQKLRQMMEQIVTELQGDLKLADADRDFVIDHYTLTVLGHLLHWLTGGMTDDPFPLVYRLERIMHGSTQQSLAEFTAPSDRANEHQRTPTEAPCLHDDAPALGTG